MDKKHYRRRNNIFEYPFNYHVPLESSQCTIGKRSSPCYGLLKFYDVGVKIFSTCVSNGRTRSSFPWFPQVELVRWTQSVGLTLVNRDLNSLQLKTPSGQILSFYILQIFPFTSESKRMGIIVRVCYLDITMWCVAAPCVEIWLMIHTFQWFLHRPLSCSLLSSFELHWIWLLDFLTLLHDGWCGRLYTAKVLIVICNLIQEESTGDITFYMKGADVAMASIVQYNDWLEEEVKALSESVAPWRCS